MNKLAKEIVKSLRRAVALQLWELGAVKVNLKRPFKLVSGNYSPIYVNCRQLISSTLFVELFSAAARALCDEQEIEFDVLAGGETAGIPLAAFLTRSFNKPMVYVRKTSKSHGISSLVEGAPIAGSRVFLVEDLITDAGSKKHFIDGIKAAGGIVTDVLVVFDRMQGGAKTLRAMNIRLLSVTDMDTTLNVAQTTGILKASQQASVERYLQSPIDWHKENNLPYRA